MVKVLSWVWVVLRAPMMFVMVVLVQVVLSVSTPRTRDMVE